MIQHNKTTHISAHTNLYSFLEKKEEKKKGRDSAKKHGHGRRFV